ncbi:selenocysteine-tRNA-specific elongation factor, putative [Trypanosoma cruzi marinkellei]|uniref:Selenocysteine-tRNA-specific elongation factor, putative n=1 Tax=Trypanosoma cruzi marinkellei TaxID=85056 RepID=K2M3Z9_TRYCR|nr:selenocysteine-tRNA-specific elongation factor, putative [Trypanosoma cruzi marinkellei]
MAGYFPDVWVRFWATTFPSPNAFDFSHLPLDEHSATEEGKPRFCAFDVSGRPTRLWNEGVAGIVVDLRGAHNYWQQADDQAKLVFDSLVAWVGVLETKRELPDLFLKLSTRLLQAFRLQLMMAPEPGIPLYKPRARPPTAVREADAYAGATPPLAKRRGAQRTPRRQRRGICGHDATTRSSRDAFTKNYFQRGRPLKTVRGLPAACEGGRGRPHSLRRPSPSRTGVEPHRTADAPHELPNCSTQSTTREMGLIRQIRSSVARQITDIPALVRLYEESERGGSRGVCAVSVGAENVPSGAICKLLLHARTTDQRGELRGLFDGDSRCGAIDPTAARQDAAVPVAKESNPAGHGDSQVTKNCVAIGDEAGAPRQRNRGTDISAAGPTERNVLFFDLRG